MAPAPKKPCARCKKTLTTGTYCPACAEIVTARPQAETRPTATARGYDGQWKKIRDWKLQRDPLCERCQANGQTVAAVLVHHRDRNSENNDPENHESMCLKCHQLEHRFDGVDSMRRRLGARYTRPGRWT